MNLAMSEGSGGGFRLCPHCGGRVVATGRFCGFCGGRVETPEPPKEAALSEPNLMPRKHYLGREAELREIPPLAAEALNGRGQILYVEGVAGIGKSSFFHQVAPFLERNGFRVMRLEGSRTFAQFTLFPFHRLVVETLGLASESRPEELPGQLESLKKLGLSTGDARALARLFPVELKPSSNDKLDDMARMTGLFAALSHLIQRLARQTPLALFVDHTHLADPYTRRYLQTLEDLAAEERLFILAASREEGSVLSPRPNVHSLTLSGLRLRDLIYLARLYLGTSQLPMEIEEKLETLTDGVPLRVFMLLDYLREREYIQLVRGSWKVNEKYRGMEFPLNLEKTLGARMELMKPHIQEILRIVAVLGDDGDVSTLAALYPYPQHLTHDIEDLANRRLIRVATQGGAQRVAFSHNAIEEYIYERIPAAGLQSLHQKAAAHFSRSEPIRRYLKPWLLDIHQGFMREKSTQFMHAYEREGDRHLHRLHVLAAVQAFQKASQTLRQLGESDPERGIFDHKLMTLLMKLARGYQVLGDLERAEKSYRLLLSLSARRKTGYMAIEALLALSELLMSRGRTAQAQECCHQAVLLAEEQADPYSLSRARLGYGEWYRRQGMYREAEGQLSEAMALAEKTEAGVKPAVRWSAEIRYAMGQLRMDRGQYDPALALLVEAMNSAIETRNVPLHIKILERLAVLSGYQKDFARADRYLALAMEASREAGDPAALANLSLHSGRLYLLRGDRESARLAFLDSARLCREIHWSAGLERSRLALAKLTEGADGLI